MVDEEVVSERIRQIAATLADRAAELTGELVQLYAADLPQLVNDDERMVSLLSASVYQNIETALQIFRHGIDPATVEPPAAAMEYARRLAQRGTPVFDLIRAYDLGQAAMLDFGFQECIRVVDDAALLGAMMRRLLKVAYEFITRVVRQLVGVYQDERDRWLLNRSAARAAKVLDLLGENGGPPDVDAAEAVIGYRLRGTHVGLVVWHASEAHDVLSHLESVAGAVLERAGGEGRPLFVPRDEAGAWAWLPVASVRREHLDAALADADPGVRVTVGDPGTGVDGFRDTHQQARRVHALALAAGEHCDRVLTFREVGTVALMTSDLNAARLWVASTLGPMSADDENCGRLRETLRVFLASGGSYTAAAAELTMHKNSVQYRVRKAQELLPRGLGEGRLDVELALNLCQRLGAAVLTPA
ncbi:helix-turn-helix domain-containing protein [Amycolatopsis sp. SID8362]|uniref:PucR family transcriptional regulator n=1 Tax=Amycolatopsis sp. SID8362 TaxID=2690346 RepID=UPI0013693121|nr:helix-turn-helix domain-containing protein [Amycolatopsis sp. SID8362]NBH07630.1 ABC transporter substrate-binding protein [Amycolatopsis sp. SID8362]NED44326.1 ABC transporter substrate-binding protein [Amycolatopsis sp. SID8362]